MKRMSKTGYRVSRQAGLSASSLNLRTILRLDISRGTSGLYLCFLLERCGPRMH